MRTEALLFIATVSLLVINACSKEMPEPQRGEEKVFIAQSGEEDDTKTAFQDDEKSIWWSPYDAICIYYGASDGDKFTATNDTEVAKAEFRGTLTAFTGVSESGDFNYFWAVYPYAAARGCDGNSVTAELSERQIAKAGTFAPNTNISIAKSPGLALSFFNACSWFRFSLKKEGVKRVIFRGNNNEDIAGTFRISMDEDGRPTAPEFIQGKKEIILEMPNHEAFEVGQMYYITLLPQVFENGFTVTFETDSETGSRTISKKATYVRSKYNSGVEFDKDVVYAPDIVSFSNANFKAYCVQNFDSNGDGEISAYEARAVTYINVNSKNITSLGGIEAFSNLTHLSCYSNQITTLDVSNNTALRQLECGSNQLTTLDMSNNTALEWLNCGFNQLTALDVSNNTALEYLSCYGNQLTTLNVSNNTALEWIDCGSNQLTALDVSHNTALEHLSCYSNQLTALDVSHNTALEHLSCYSNQLTALDVSHNTALNSLNCGLNQLNALDVSNNTALEWLYCSGNPNLAELWLKTGQEIADLYYDLNITSLYYKGPVYFADSNFKAYCVQNFDTDGDGEISAYEARAVTYIYVHSQNITSLVGIKAFSNLTELSCYSNQLTTLDVSNNTALEFLNCGANQLTALDVSNNTALEFLNCGANQLTALDVSHNTALKYLYCDSNQLTTLDVSNNTALTQLTCGSNQLTTLDVSNNTALEWLDCGSNQLTALDVSHNTALKYLNCTSNQLTTLDVSQNTALEVLHCNSNQLTALDVSNNTALKYLYCISNQLTTLDVSQNTALEFLNCGANQLTALDVSNNTALKYLYCTSNQLTTLDVSQNTALEVLYCNSNQLTALDVSNNTALEYLNCSGNPNLAELWLKTGQEIARLYYDSNITHLYYKP